MPIRMTDDEPSDDQESSSDEDEPKRKPGGGGSGGGGGILALLGLFAFFLKFPKLTLTLLLIGGVVLYVASRDPAGKPGPQPKPGAVAADHGEGRGATLDPKVYDEALVHEPIYSDGSKSPARVSLLAAAPPRGSQGAQGSCVGWATSYAARSILHTVETGQKGTIYSPSFTYNPIAKENCQGSFIVRALERLRDVGDVPFNEFEYDPKSCDRQPEGALISEAKAHRIRGFTRLSLDAEDYRTNSKAVKDHLAQNAPVVIGMRVGGTFQSAMRGQRVWHPTQADYDSKGDWGGHAMAVIGYDDNLEGGAFQIMNSWGPKWGEDGVAFVKYKDFNHFVREAYGLYPMRSSASAAAAPQQIRFGLIEVDAKGAPTQHRIAFKPQGEMVFRTSQPIRKGTRFKVELQNTRPVYTYLFGQESNGKSYVLFPYTPKHSPYCGTSGTRVFPRKQSLTADAIGTRDAVAVVIAEEPLDPVALNRRIDAQRASTYADRLKSALGGQLRRGSKATAGPTGVELASASADRGVEAMVLEFDKR